ncbi:MAG: TIGR03435 family protein [Janthinobacterium lividum]
MRISLRRLLQALSFAVLIWGAAQAQQDSAARTPAFETASIRSSHFAPGCFSMLPPGGTQYALTCVTVRNLIQMAYKASYIEGGGSAIDTYYDLRATMPDGEPWTLDSVRLPTQQFLTERFHLKRHAGTREVAGYSMVVAKSGPKLHAVAPASVVQGQKSGEPSQNFTAPGYVQGRGLGPREIASLLSVVERVPVVDHTGLTGTFNVDLRYAPDGDTNSNLPSFLTALEEQLGLKLKPDKVTVDTLVIDHVDDTPTPN